MRIQVNGEARAAVADASVADLLRELDIRGDRVAVELNLEILDRKEFESRKLREGDRVEILSFIGGGSGRYGAGGISVLAEAAPQKVLPRRAQWRSPQPHTKG